MNDDRPMDLDADLIELALASRRGEPADGEPLSELDPGRRARALELRAFLDGCRAAVAGESPGAESPGAEENGSNEHGFGDAGSPAARPATNLDALADRVLAATTREDLSWRGDLRLVGGFVVAHLRSSRMLRIAALVLAMHFVGLSVLAYHVLSRPNEPFINVDFEDRPELPFPEEVVEPGGALSLPEAGEEPRVRELPTDEQPSGDR